jgi:hypothetical protein
MPVADRFGVWACFVRWRGARPTYVHGIPYGRYRFDSAAVPAGQLRPMRDG